MDDSSLMVKLDGTVRNFKWYIYAGHRYSEEACLGGRLTWQIGDLRLRSSILMESVEINDREDFFRSRF